MHDFPNLVNIPDPTTFNASTFAKFDDRNISPNFRDLREFQDDKKILRNPHKGWYWHYIDNGYLRDNYRKNHDPNDHLERFPGLNHLYLRFDWGDIEVEEGVYDWSWLDNIVENLESRGIKPWFNVGDYKKDNIRVMNIGYIFQDYKLIDNLSVYDNIALALKMIGIKDKKEIKKRIDYVLETLNMYRYRNRLAGMLSGGERQRVGIARAIVKNPNIIIADEPTGNLDSKNSLEIMNIIKAISKDKLVILVTHEEELAKFYASRIIEIQDGKVMKDYINEHNSLFICLSYESTTKVPKIER